MRWQPHLISDGYTFLGNASVTGSDTVLYNVPYTPDDFMPVARLAMAPLILVASQKSGITSVGELIRRARKAPNTINLAASGIGVLTHLAGVEFMDATNTEMMHIPYAGGAAATQSIASGGTDISFATASSARPVIDTGRAIGLGITSSQPSVLIPEYQPIADLGVPGYNIGNWWGIFAPKGTPKNAIQTVFNATNQVLARDEVRTSFASMSEEVAPMRSVEEFVEFAHTEGQRILRLAHMSCETKN